MKTRAYLLILIILAPFVYAEYSELRDIKKESKKAIKKYSIGLSNVDPKFEGVVNFAISLQTIENPEDVNIAEITVQSQDYWRAVMEMAPSDPSILFAHAHLYAAQGQIERAKTYLILGNISMGDELKSEFNKFKKRIEKLEKRAERDIKKGIALHDKQKYTEAIKIYDMVLKEHPNCAWAYYEKAFSYLTMWSEKKNEDYKIKYEQMLAQCRECDPFYWQAYSGNNKNNRLNKMLTIMGKIHSFSSGEKRDKEAFIKYAEGCEEIEIYAIAAHARWKLAQTDGDNAKTHLKKFLELIEKAGCKDTQLLRDQFILDEED
jgi:tetratricopeptide (TPR) repeat protein